MITYDDFSTDPNITGEWTEYVYYSSDGATETWNSVDQDLDLVQTAGQRGIGLYRTGSSRSATDPVTMTVEDFSRTSNTWGFLGLMITAAEQQAYLAGTGDSYTLALADLGGGNVRPEVRSSYGDAGAGFQLYVGATEAFAGPYVLDIERNGANYDFKVNGSVVYTASYYNSAAHDSMTSYQIMMAGDGNMTATVDDFGIPTTGGAIPEPVTMAALGLAVAGLGGYVRRRRKA